MKLLFVLSLCLFAWIQSPIYDFIISSLDGSKIKLSDYKGKKILLVNTASQCGNTHQYADLEKLYKTHKDKLVIIGFPANNFGAQEPGTNVEIMEFCQKNYGVSFPMTEKVSVTGEDASPIYKYLIDEAKKKGLANPVNWNFGKFLLDEEGNLVATFGPKTLPLSADILKAIE